MENEGELRKATAHDADGSFNEAEMDRNVDRIVKSHQSNLFVAKKTNKTVFQAQKDEKK